MVAKDWLPGYETRQALCPVCKKVYKITNTRNHEGEIMEVEWRDCKCKD